MCVFHLKINHDGESFPDVVYMIQLLMTNELSTSMFGAEMDSCSNGDSINSF